MSEYALPMTRKKIESKYWYRFMALSVECA